MNKLSKISSILILGVTFISVESPIALAQDSTDFGPSGESIELTNPLGSDTIIGVINNIIVGLRDTIAPPLVAIAVLYGGFMMLFASGDPDKFKKGKKAILYAMVGYAIILIAGGITSLIKDVIGG